MTPKVLSSDGWNLVRCLTEGDYLDGWTLAGGTGLALQLGHRYSAESFGQADSTPRSEDPSSRSALRYLALSHGAEVTQQRIGSRLEIQQ